MGSTRVVASSKNKFGAQPVILLLGYHLIVQCVLFIQVNPFGLNTDTAYIDLESAFSESMQSVPKKYKIAVPFGGIPKLEGAIPQPALNACQVLLLYTLQHRLQYK